MTKPHSGKFIKCWNCKKEFYIPKNRYNTAKYCSKKCKDKFNVIHIKANCKICGKEFEHISSRCNKAKYCSRLCYHRSQKGKGSKEYECANCHKKFMGSPSKRYKFCTPKCRGKYKRNPETYINFSDVRKAWKCRGWIKKCQICGYDKEINLLGLHHKDRNRKNQQKENIMILCPMCHSSIHHKHIVQ